MDFYSHLIASYDDYTDMENGNGGWKLSEKWVVETLHSHDNYLKEISKEIALIRQHWTETCTTNMSDINVRVARIEAIVGDASNYITNQQFDPIKRIVYGIVAVGGTAAFLSAVAHLVLNK